MANYCDEFSFDDVFEDPSYVEVFVKHSAQVKYPYPSSYEDLDYKTIKNDKNMVLDLDVLDLDDLDFINDESISSSNKVSCVNRRGFDTALEEEEEEEEEEEDEEEFDEYEFYYQKKIEIMMV
jgi:hypothetical protein